MDSNHAPKDEIYSLTAVSKQLLVVIMRVFLLHYALYSILTLRSVRHANKGITTLVKILIVWVGRFEHPTSWTQTTRTTSCATPRIYINTLLFSGTGFEPALRVWNRLCFSLVLSITLTTCWCLLKQFTNNTSQSCSNLTWYIRPVYPFSNTRFFSLNDCYRLHLLNFTKQYPWKCSITLSEFLLPSCQRT